MTHRLIVATRICTAIAWVIAGLDLTPALDLAGNVALYCVAIGCVGAYALITAAHTRPVDEVYLAGKAVGRREAQLEQECERVTRLSERRLTVVNGDRAGS